MELEQRKNEDFLKLALSNIKHLERNAKLGGGKARLERIRKEGKLTARERVNYLLDEQSEQFEIGLLAGTDCYQDYGGCPAGGVVVVVGQIEGQWCVVVANDASVKAGAWFPITTKKNLRAQEIALENRIPIIYLVDSAGIFLPLQNELFADKDFFGRIFRNNAQMSAAGIVQIAAVMGSCVAGGAYLPVMSDEVIMVDKSSSIFLAGSYLVKAAIGENIDNEILGGATTHTEISGVGDYKAKNDKDALDRIKKLINNLGPLSKAGFNRVKAIDPKKSIQNISGVLPKERNEPYDTNELLAHLLDADTLEEYKPDYGKTILTAYARIEGWSVGIVANQRKIIKNKKGEIQFGGVIYSDSADKATRFIANCNQRKIPLVFLQDVTGFMVGSDAEHGGIIKDGAKMVNAVSNSIVPKFTIVVGNSYGAGNYAMCGKAFDPRFIVSWPTAKIAVMGGEQAGNVLLQIQKSAAKKKGEKVETKKEEQLLNEIKEKYEAQTTPTFAAARMWLDAVIDPTNTRKWISMGLALADHAPIEKKFSMGILQV